MNCTCKNPDITVIQDGVIQAKKVCIHHVFRVIKAAGVGMDEILNGRPVFLNGVYTSFLDCIRMSQRERDTRYIDGMSPEELEGKPWLLNR